MAIYAKNNFTTSRLNHDVYVYAQKYDNFPKLYNGKAIAVGFEGQYGIWEKACDT